MPLPPSQVLDQKTMEDFFAARLRLFPGADAVVNLAIHRHEPRLVFDPNVVVVKYELTLKMRDGSTALVIVRGSADQGEKREKSYLIMKSLWEKGFDRGRYLVPEPLIYSPELHLCLYRNAPGQSLMQGLERGREHYCHEIAEGVNWLIKFHTEKPTDIPEPPFSWDREKRSFVELVANVSAKYPTQQARIARVSDLIIKQEKILLREDSFSLVHGDYQPNNIIIDHQKVTVIDFNDAFPYDELLDLAYFLTQVKFMVRRLPDADISGFLEQETAGYFEKRHLTYDELARKKIHLFTARTLLHIKALVTHDVGEKILDEIESHAQNAI